MSSFPSHTHDRHKTVHYPRRGYVDRLISAWVSPIWTLKMSDLSLTASAVIRPLSMVLRGEKKDKPNEEAQVHPPRQPDHGQGGRGHQREDPHPHGDVQGLHERGKARIPQERHHQPPRRRGHEGLREVQGQRPLLLRDLRGYVHRERVQALHPRLRPRDRNRERDRLVRPPRQRR